MFKKYLLYCANEFAPTQLPDFDIEHHALIILSTANVNHRVLR